jgi:hypothetical protein
MSHILVHNPHRSGPSNDIHACYLNTVEEGVPYDFESPLDSDCFVRGSSEDFWSNTLLYYAEAEIEHLKVTVEGPYSTCCPKETLIDRDLIIFIAAGQGIGPILPLAQSVCDGSGTYSLATLDAPPPRQQIVLIWIWEDTATRDHFLHEMHRLEGYGAAEVREIGPSDETFQKANHIDEEIVWIMNKYDQTASKRTAVVSAAPRWMRRAVRNLAAKQRAEGWRVLVEEIPDESELL